MFPFSLFGGLSLKLVLILALSTTILGMGTGLYFSIKHSGVIEQQLKDQKKEYERVIGDQKQTIEDQKSILDLNEASISDLTKDIEGHKLKFQDLSDFLDSDEARAEDRPASDLLKKIIEKLARENGDIK